MRGTEVVEDHARERHAAPLHGFERQERVVDGPQFARRHEPDGPTLFGHVVDREELARKRHHEAARPFDEHRLVFGVERRERALDLHKVHRTAVKLGREMGRGRIAEGFGHRASVSVGGEKPRPHEASVRQNVGREFVRARLHELGGDDFSSFLKKACGEPPGRDGLPRVRVDAAHKLQRHDVFSKSMVTG